MKNDYKSFIEGVSSTFSGDIAKTWNDVGSRMLLSLGDDNVIRSWMVNLLNDGDTIVDFGSGAGKLIKQISNVVSRGVLIGVDISRDMATTAVKTNSHLQNSESYEYQQFVCPIEDCPLPSGVADLVLSKMVLHHVSSPVVAVKEMARVLKKGGHILGMVPGDRYQGEYFKFDPAQKDPLGRFSYDQLRGLVEQAGLFHMRTQAHTYVAKFSNLYEYLQFENGIGSTGKVLGYQDIAIVRLFQEMFKGVFESIRDFSFVGEYYTFDAMKIN